MRVNIFCNFVLASFLFLFVIAMAFMHGDFSKSIEEYVVFVLTTNFSIDSSFRDTHFFQKLADWDLPSFLKARPKADSGW